MEQHLPVKVETPSERKIRQQQDRLEQKRHDNTPYSHETTGSFPALEAHLGERFTNELVLLEV
jgi:hypothetical protein